MKGKGVYNVLIVALNFVFLTINGRETLEFNSPRKEILMKSWLSEYIIESLLSSLNKNGYDVYFRITIINK